MFNYLRNLTIGLYSLFFLLVIIRSMCFLQNVYSFDVIYCVLFANYLNVQ